MGNLIKHTNLNLPAQVSNKSRSVYIAHNCDMIKNISDMNIVVNSIHQSINRSVADKGVNIVIEELDYIKRSVTDDVLKEFNILSLQDIQLCFSMGVRGNLGEYFGINVVTFYNWLKKYKEDIIPETMGEIKKYLLIDLIEEKVDFKQLDLEKINTICNILSTYNESGIYDFNDFGNIHYKFLNKFNSIDEPSLEEIMNLKEYAKLELILETKEKNLTLIAQRKNYQLNNLNKLLSDIEFGTKDTESMIQIIFLKLLLKRYIINLSKLEIDVAEFRIDLINKIEIYYGT